MDFKQIGLIWQKPFLLGVCFVSVFLGFILQGWRWQKTLQYLKIHQPFLKTLKMQFIGLFFNFTMPSSVGGDVVKVYYIIKKHPNKKQVAVFSAVMDRLMALIALSSIPLFSVWFSTKKLLVHPYLSQIYVYLIVAWTLLLALPFLLWGLKPVRLFVKRYVFLSPLFKKDFPKFVFLHFSITFLAQFFFHLVVYLIFQNFSLEPFTWWHSTFVFALSSLIMSLPIAFAGIGTGQVAFHYLILWGTGQGNTWGPIAISCLQLVMFICSLLGICFYIGMKSEQKSIT